MRKLSNKLVFMIMKNLEFGTYWSGDVTQNFRIEMYISRSIISHLKNAFLNEKKVETMHEW